MTVYYFVSYEYVRRDDSDDPIRSMVILKGIHPLVWAANPPAIFLKHFSLTRVLFFAEIPAEVAERDDVRKWCGVETELTPDE